MQRIAFDQVHATGVLGDHGSTRRRALDEADLAEQFTRTELGEHDGPTLYPSFDPDRSAAHDHQGASMYSLLEEDRSAPEVDRPHVSSQHRPVVLDEHR